MYTRGINIYKTALIIFLFITFLLLPSPTFAQVIINEFMPNPELGEEWVELYNSSNTPIDLSNYAIDDILNGGGAEKKIGDLIPNPTIEPSSYLVIELGSRFLNNDSDEINLLKIEDNYRYIIDRFSYASTEEGKSYSRCPDNVGEFIITASSPGILNICPSPTPSPYSTPTPTPTPFLTPTPILTLSPTPTSIPTPTPSQTSSISNLNIELSEIYPNPYSGESEWIEIYNPNEFEVELTNWILDDEEGGSSPITFSTKIPPKSFFVLDLPKVMLNNSGDEVRLFNSNEKLIDQVSYKASQKGFSFAKDEKGNWCFQSPTKAEKNNPCSTQNSTDTDKNSTTQSSPTSTFTSIKNKTIPAITSSLSTPSELAYNTFQYPTQDKPEVLGEKIKLTEREDQINYFKAHTFSFLTLQLNILTFIFFVFKLTKLI